MSALNLPSATDVERLERRLRSFSQRLEDVEEADRRPQPRTRARCAAKTPKKNAEEKQSLTLDLRVRVRPRRRVRRVSPPPPAPRPGSCPESLLSVTTGPPRRRPRAPRRRRAAPRSACRPPRPGPRAGRARAGGGCRGWRPRRRRASAALAKRRGQLRVGSARARWHRRRGAAQACASRDDEQLAERQVAERGAGADPDRPPHSQLGQVGEDDRGARPAHPGRLDRQLAPGRRSTPCSPTARGRGCSSSARSSSSWASISARPGSPTRIASAAIGAVGRRRAGICAVESSRPGTAPTSGRNDPCRICSSRTKTPWPPAP